jgi:K+-sensing histidine kinase KdpD
LVNDILDFAQLRAGKFRKNKENFYIDEAVQEII